MIDYFINAFNIADLGIRVETSKGVIDVPKLKNPPEVSWNEYSGVSVDLRNKRYESRELEFSCFMTADDNVQLAERMQFLFNNLFGNRILQLRIFIKPDRPLVYMVYGKEKIEVKKSWRENGKIIATFTLKFIEPEPEKIVIKYTQSDLTLGWGTFGLVTESFFNIYWGDYNTGSFSANTDNELMDQVAPLLTSPGDPDMVKTFEHKFLPNGDKYTVVTGDTSLWKIDKNKTIWIFGNPDDL